MKLKSKINDLLKQNSIVQDLKKFIDLHVKVDDIPEAFVKKHFKDEKLILNIQNAIQEEHDQHVYACKIVKHLIKYTTKVLEGKIMVIEEEIPREPEDDSQATLYGIDYSDHGSDPGYYEGRFNEINLKNQSELTRVKKPEKKIINEKPIHNGIGFFLIFKSIFKPKLHQPLCHHPL